VYRLINLNNPKAKLAVVVSLGNESINLPIGPLISKRNRDELIPEKQFDLLNGYLQYKGDEFKTELYSRVHAAELAVHEAALSICVSASPVGAISTVLDMFDMADVYMYVRDIYKVLPPKDLKESFDPRIETDGLGTRIQTYIQQDYWELASLTLPIKAVIGLLGLYSVRNSSIASVHQEYVLYRLIAEHAIAKHPAAIKIQQWAEVLMGVVVKSNDISAITVIEKQIPISELGPYLLSTVVIQKLGIAAIVADVTGRNVVTRIYNYIINRLKTNGSSSNKIRDKKPMRDDDSLSGDKESVIESYRMVTRITAGIETEYEWYTGDMKLLIRDMDVKVNGAILEDAVHFNQCFRSIAVTKEQVVLAGYIFKRILDPRALDYVGIDGIINLLSLGFAMLWDKGHRELAMLLVAKALVEDESCVAVNVTPNIRLDPMYKRRLDELYPYLKHVNKTTTVSVVEEAVTTLTNNIFKYKWLPNVPDHCIEEMYGKGNIKLLPTNLKDLICRLIIDIEEEKL